MLHLPVSIQPIYSLIREHLISPACATYFIYFIALRRYWRKRCCSCCFVLFCTNITSHIHVASEQRFKEEVNTVDDMTNGIVQGYSAL